MLQEAILRISTTDYIPNSSAPFKVLHACKDRNGNTTQVPIIPTGGKGDQILLSALVDWIHTANVINKNKYAVHDTKYIVNSTTANAFMTKHLYFFRSKPRIEAVFHKALVKQSQTENPTQSTEVETLTSAVSDLTGIVG